MAGEYARLATKQQSGHRLGFIVAGYSRGKFEPKHYRFDIPPQGKAPFELSKATIFPGRTGILVERMPDAVHRMIFGIDPSLARALSKISFSDEQIDLLRASLKKEKLANLDFSFPSDLDLAMLYEATSDKVRESDRFKNWISFGRYFLDLDGMPLQDAIDLSIWLIELTIGRYRFASIWPYVAGDIDVAVITHSDFTWVRRKAWHAYRREPDYFIEDGRSVTR